MCFPYINWLEKKKLNFIIPGNSKSARQQISAVFAKSTPRYFIWVLPLGEVPRCQSTYPGTWHPTSTQTTTWHPRCISVLFIPVLSPSSVKISHIKCMLNWQIELKKYITNFSIVLFNSKQVFYIIILWQQFDVISLFVWARECLEMKINIMKTRIFWYLKKHLAEHSTQELSKISNQHPS